MATHVQLHRGTTAQNDNYTGLQGELTIDTDKHSVRVHDGITKGGHEIVSNTDNFSAEVENNAELISKLYTRTNYDDIAPSITHNYKFRGANLLDGHFESVDAIVEAVRAGDFSDIYVGDMFSLDLNETSGKNPCYFIIAGINKGGLPHTKDGVYTNYYLCLLMISIDMFVMQGVSGTIDYIQCSKGLTNCMIFNRVVDNTNSLLSATNSPLNAYLLYTDEYLFNSTPLTDMSNCTYTENCLCLFLSVEEYYGGATYAGLFSKPPMYSFTDKVCKLPLFIFPQFTVAYYAADYTDAPELLVYEYKVIHEDDDPVVEYIANRFYVWEGGESSTVLPSMISRSTYQEGNTLAFLHSSDIGSRTGGSMYHCTTPVRFFIG